MKYINIKALFLSAIIAGSGIFSSCENAKYDTLDVHAYIEEALSNSSSKVTVPVEGESRTSLNIRISDVSSTDNHYLLIPDQSVLDEYNRINGTGYVMLPAESYTLPDDIIVKAGSYAGDAVSLVLKSFSDEMMKSGESYALPLRLILKNGTAEAMQTTGTFVVLAESIVKFSAPQFTGTADLVAKKFEETPETYNAYTIEVRFQVSNTANRNRAVFSSSDGNGKSILLRFEDPQSTNANFKAHSLVQIQLHDSYVNPIYSFEPNKWQHLAVTFDGSKYKIYINGREGGSLASSNAEKTFKEVTFFSAGNFWSGCKILMSEARIWSVARSASQIQNNMTQVSPKSAGLEAYWRFNEGSGNTFEDATGKGHTLTTDKTPVWIDGILSTDDATNWK